MAQYFKKHAAALKDGKEDELKQQLTEVADYLDELGRKNSGDPVPHLVLNARYHEQEANIIAQAGVPGTVTIATNMAGRGTDIQLGGNDRYRVRDWMKEELEAGRLAAVHGEGDDQELLRKWIDDILYVGDDWIESRLGRWIEDQVAEASEAAGAQAGRSASARDVSVKRRQIEGDKRGLAEKRSRDRQGICRQRQGGRSAQRPRREGLSRLVRRRPAR